MKAKSARSSAALHAPRSESRAASFARGGRIPPGAGDAHVPEGPRLHGDLARRIRLEDADIARLVENFERENPSTFETRKYLFELREGIRGPGLRVADLAGLSLPRFRRHPNPAYMRTGDYDDETQETLFYRRIQG